MNRLKNSIAVFAFSMLVLSLPIIASAQYRNDRDRDDDGYSRNDDYRNNRNNRGGRNNRNLESTVKNLKNRSKQFERRLDRELDNSRYDNSNREDRINQLAKDFADAADDLENNYDDRNGSNDAQRVLQLGNQLDRAVSRARLNGNIQNDWNNIRYDLDTLANAYGGYNDNNRNNRSNRNNRRNRQSNGDWRNNIPFPLPF